MKHIKLFLAGAAVILLASSCGQILESMSKNPIYEFAGSTVYDGQSAFLGTVASCKIGWTNSNPDIVTLDYNEKGKECVATFKLPADQKKITSVTITATNLDDSSVDPFTDDITVAPWKIGVYKKNSGGKWDKVETKTVGGLSSFVYSAYGAGTYKLQLEYLNSDDTYKAINSIPYRLSKAENFKVKWGGKLLGIDGLETTTACSKEFELSSIPLSGQNQAVAYIGDVEHVVLILI